MSRSDRQLRGSPQCFGSYDADEAEGRACYACLQGLDCIGMTAASRPTIEAVKVVAKAKEPARSKYHREIKPGVWVDVYDVLQAFGVTNPALQHAIKKALAPGQRGHKDRATDMDEIVQSAIRARELEA